METVAEQVSPARPATGISPGRRAMVYCVIAAILVPHLYDIARQQEHWPYSNYPMWARLSKDWHVMAVAPVGLTEDPARPEVELSDPAYFAPVPLHFQRLTFGPLKKSSARRDKVLGDYLRRYEDLRRAGKHDGPPLVGIRLYERYWDMDKRASNAATPDRTTLVYEYRSGSAPTSAPAASTLPTTEAAAGAH
jgi:hypothetical protein